MTVVDIHAHFEPRMFSVDKMRAQMAASGVDRVALIPAMNDPLPETPTRLIALVRGLMCSPAHSLAKLVHLATMKDGNLKLSGKIYEIYSKPDNAQVAEVLRAHPELFVGWIFLNPRDERQCPRGARTVESGSRLCRRQAPSALARLGDRRGRADSAPLRGARASGLDSPRVRQERRLATNRRRLPEAQSALRTCRHAALSAPMAPHARLPESLSRSLEPLSRRSTGQDEPSPRWARSARSTEPTPPTVFTTQHDPESYDYTHIKGWVERLPASSSDIDRVLGINAGELLS